MVNPEEINSIQFVDSYYPVVDGVVEMVNQYATIMNQTSYCSVVCPKTKDISSDKNREYDIIRTASLRLPKIEYPVCLPVNRHVDRKLAELVELKNINLIHVHSPVLQRFAAVRLAKKFNIPLVTTFHSKYYDDVYRSTKSRWLAEKLTANIIKFYNQCDSVWACSKGTAQTLRSYGYKGDIFVMENGTSFVPPEDPQRLKALAAEKYGFKADERILLFVGTITFKKNLDLAIDSFKKVLEKPGKWRFVLTGGGPEMDSVIRYARKAGIPDDRILFTGRINDKDLLSGIFMNADLFFFPSVYDNAPLVLREAAAMGIPGLLTEGSNAAEVIEPDVNGFVAKENSDSMAQKIISIFEADEESHGTAGSYLKNIGKKAAETIVIPWKELIPKVYEKYGEIIEEKRLQKQ